jgi:hypothetical protein
MNMIDEAVQDVVGDYSRWTKAFQNEHADKVDGLAAVIDGIGYENLGDDFFDLMDDFRGDFAARAANRFEKEQDQEAAISAVEEWFTDNITNSSSSDVALAALYYQGVLRSDELVDAIQAAAAPATRVR